MIPTTNGGMFDDEKFERGLQDDPISDETKATYYDLVKGETGLDWEDAAQLMLHAQRVLKKKHEENRRKAEGELPGDLKPGDKVHIVAAYGFARKNSEECFTGPFDLDLKKPGDALYTPGSKGYEDHGDGYDLIGPVLCSDLLYNETGRRLLNRHDWLDLCTSALGHIGQVDGACVFCGQKIPWFCFYAH